MKTSKKSMILLLAALLCAGIMVLTLSCTSEEEVPLTKEEVTEANAAILTKHLKKVGFKSKYISNEFFADITASLLSRVSDAKIADISSELDSDGGITITVVDEEGKTFILPLTEHGSLNAIQDEKGNFVYCIVQ